MGTSTMIIADDGFEFSAYVAAPTGTVRGGVVVVQEIFGVNGHIREVCDGFAADGYYALAPAIFDRLERGVELGYTTDDIAIGRDLARGRTDFDRAVRDTANSADHLRALLRDEPANGSRVGCTGYCWGGVVTAASAVRSAGSFGCAVSYYGTGAVGFVDQPLAMPLLCHYGDQDTSIPPEDIAKIRIWAGDANVHVYAAQHGFTCDHRPQYDEAAASLARVRTLDFFTLHLG